MMDPRLHRVLLPRVDGRPGNQEVRRFNSLGIQSMVDDTLQRLKNNSAILEVELESEDGEKELRSVLAAKLGGHWSIGGFLEFRNRKNYTTGVKVLLDW